MPHRLWHAVGAEDQDAARRHVIQVFDEDRALGLQSFHHELVVHHFVPHVDRRAVQRQRALDDLDGAIDPGAETARISQEDLHRLSLPKIQQLVGLKPDPQDPMPVLWVGLQSDNTRPNSPHI